MKIESYQKYFEYIDYQTSKMSDFKIGFLLLWFIERLYYIRTNYESENNIYCDKDLLEMGLNPRNYINLAWNVYDGKKLKTTQVQKFKSKMDLDFEFLTSADVYCSSIFDILVALESFMDLIILKKISRENIYWNFYLDNIERFFNDNESYELDLLDNDDFQSKRFQNEIIKSIKVIEYINNHNNLSSNQKQLYWN